MPDERTVNHPLFVTALSPPRWAPLLRALAWIVSIFYR